MAIVEVVAISATIVRTCQHSPAALIFSSRFISNSHERDTFDVAKSYDLGQRQRGTEAIYDHNKVEYIRARTEQIAGQIDPDLASIDPDVAKTSGAATGVDFLAAVN